MTLGMREGDKYGLTDVVEGVKSKDGERVEDHPQCTTEAAAYQI